MSSNPQENQAPQKKGGQDKKNDPMIKEKGAMRPDKGGKVPPPRKPQLSQTEVDKERADWEGMTPNKPTKPDEA